MGQSGPPFKEMPSNDSDEIANSAHPDQTFEICIEMGGGGGGGMTFSTHQHIFNCLVACALKIEINVQNCNDYFICKCCSQLYFIKKISGHVDV